MSRICDEVQANLPGLEAGTLAAWRQRLVRKHLRRCDECGREHVRQVEVTAGLTHLGSDDTADTTPPDWLLDNLLTQADSPGVRGRVAVPARGAVSGARPGLSALLLVGGAVASSAVGYGTLRAARAARARLTSRG